MSMEESKVYVGLPDHLVEEVLWVAREYRTNPLSHIEGGCDVVVEYQDGSAYGYDWIKKPSRYIRSFFTGIIEYESDDFEQLGKKRQLKIARESISRLYARKYHDATTYNTAGFKVVWDASTAEEMPWKCLEEFDLSELDERSSESDASVPPGGQRRVSIEEAESRHMVHRPDMWSEPVPFGFINDEWEAMLAKMQEDDELWEYSSPGLSWPRLTGTKGIMLVRDGKVIDTIITFMT